MVDQPNPYLSQSRTQPPFSPARSTSNGKTHFRSPKPSYSPSSRSTQWHPPFLITASRGSNKNPGYHHLHPRSTTLCLTKPMVPNSIPCKRKKKLHNTSIRGGARDTHTFSVSYTPNDCPIPPRTREPNSVHTEQVVNQLTHYCLPLDLLGANTTDLFVPTTEAPRSTAPLTQLHDFPNACRVFICAASIHSTLCIADQKNSGWPGVTAKLPWIAPTVAAAFRKAPIRRVNRGKTFLVRLRTFFGVYFGA
jgi:hypothetical protein